MCGIVGYVGPRDACPILVDGLRRLEYRGYDSAGVALPVNGRVQVWKAAGRIENLVKALENLPPDPARSGIGHTRWATHGRPTDFNAHPHLDCHSHVAVVHNGIVENHAGLRRRLEDGGHRFSSETDTEVVPHLIESHYRGDLLEAVLKAVAELEGAFALAVITSREPGRIVAVRGVSPLIVGVGEDEAILASDLPAVLPHTRQAYVLEDGEVADIQAGQVRLFDTAGRPVSRDLFTVDWDVAKAEKEGYPHFMLKEIHEQPRAVRDTLLDRIDRGGADVRLQDVNLTPEQAAGLREIFLLGCGTAYHAGLVGAVYLERLARVPARAELASEFRYRDPLVAEGALAVMISQSGETADTLAALKEARRHQARILAVTNVVGSSLARGADDLLYTWAGPEVAVASTKAYMTQLTALLLLAVRLGRARGVLAAGRAEEILTGLEELPARLEEAVAVESEAAAVAKECAGSEHMFYLGRGLDWAAAQEGQLKIKEISYIHAEAHAAGELKHGTLALITDDTPVVALLTQPHLYEKILSNVEEVRARGGRIIAVAYDDDSVIDGYADRVLRIPQVDPLLAPMVAAVPLQLLAYHAGVARGCDVDKPRNLAKSVTVE